MMTKMTKWEFLDKLHRLEKLAGRLTEDTLVFSAEVNWRNTDMIQLAREGESRIEVLAEIFQKEVTREEKENSDYVFASFQTDGITVLELANKEDA